jgi:hypothetical protein
MFLSSSMPFSWNHQASSRVISARMGGKFTRMQPCLQRMAGFFAAAVLWSSATTSRYTGKGAVTAGAAAGAAAASAAGGRGGRPRGGGPPSADARRCAGASPPAATCALRSTACIVSADSHDMTRPLPSRAREMW